MNVDFSFCLIFNKELNFSITEPIFQRTQAFASPTDMANIPHTPSKVGVLESIIFSHTPDEAMSVGLAKACVL